MLFIGGIDYFFYNQPFNISNSNFYYSKQHEL